MRVAYLQAELKRPSLYSRLGLFQFGLIVYLSWPRKSAYGSFRPKSSQQLLALSIQSKFNGMNPPLQFAMGDYSDNPSRVTLLSH